MHCNVSKSQEKKSSNTFLSLQEKKSSNTFFSNSFMNITVQYHSFIFILRFDNFAWNYEIGTLLNFRGNIIYASSFLIFVKNFTCDAIHLVHILITYLLT
jgi:hypothetical protein